MSDFRGLRAAPPGSPPHARVGIREVCRDSSGLRTLQFLTPKIQGPPLSLMSCSNKPLARGEAIRILTDIEPRIDRRRLQISGHRQSRSISSGSIERRRSDPSGRSFRTSGAETRELSSASATKSKWDHFSNAHGRWRLFVRAGPPSTKALRLIRRSIRRRISKRSPGGLPCLLAGVQMLSKGNLCSLPEESSLAWRLQLACTPEQTHLPYGCQSTVWGTTGHWRGSEMGFLCRHSPHLRVSPIRCPNSA